MNREGYFNTYSDDSFSEEESEVEEPEDDTEASPLVDASTDGKAFAKFVKEKLFERQENFHEAIRTVLSQRESCKISNEEYQLRVKRIHQSYYSWLDAMSTLKEFISVF